MLIILTVTAEGAVPSVAPVLVIDAQAHVLPISTMGLDRTRRRIVTVGRDKTVRIWQLPELHLVRTLRVPMETGNEGLLFAAAVSPDGQQIAVGGWTGWDWNKAASVYIFDTDSGKLVRRLAGLPDLVSAIIYSSDGTRLVVGLQNQGGLRVFDSATLNEIACDMEYRGSVVDVTPSASGDWLVTTSLDGMLRVYDRQLRILQRQPLGISKRPGNTEISPDGRLLALGFVDRPAVAVLRLPDLRLEYTVRADQDPDQIGLCCVGWMADGSLIATGEHGKDRALVFRWSSRGQVMRAPIDLGRQRPGGKLLLDDGTLVVATDEPRLLLLSAEGRVLQERPSPAYDLSQFATNLMISADASRIAWRPNDGPYRAFDAEKQMFIPSQGLPAVGNPTKSAAFKSTCGGTAILTAPKWSQRKRDCATAQAARWSGTRTSAPGWNVSDCRGYAPPTLNGEHLTLDPFERCVTWAVSWDNKSTVIGTSWSLRRYDASGHLLWRVHTQGRVHAIVIPRNSRFFVAALADGTLRWYDIDSGRERLGLFLHSNGADWVLWRPDGYYAASPEGDQYVGWHINDGQDNTPRFYRAVQFERVLYRPDLLRDLLGSGRAQVATDSALSIDRLQEIEPPAISISEHRDRAGGVVSAVELRIEFDGHGRAIDDYVVYHNGIPILRAEERKLDEKERYKFTRRVSIAATSGGDDIRIEAFNGTSLGLAEYYFRVPVASINAPAAGDVYVLAVGVNQFDQNLSSGSIRNLTYAAADAEAVGQAFARAVGHPYVRAHIKVLSDESGLLPTRQAVVEAFSFLQSAGRDDLVVVFLASHGFSDAAGNYFFVPRDAAAEEVMAAADGRFVDREPISLISWRTVFNSMRNLAGKRLLIVDTCQSQAVAGNFDAHSLRKRSAASHFAMMTASQTNEYSQESEVAKHGLFTYGLIEALDEKAKGSPRREVTIRSAFESASAVVNSHRNQAMPQTPQLMVPSFLAEVPLVVW